MQSSPQRAGFPPLSLPNGLPLSTASPSFPAASYQSHSQAPTPGYSRSPFPDYPHQQQQHAHGYHNEEEDELGIAKDSKYHAATLPGIGHTRDPIHQMKPPRHSGGGNSNSGGTSAATGPGNTNQSIAHHFSSLAKMGNASDEIAMDIGGLESMPFSDAGSGVLGRLAQSRANQPGMAFLKNKETRIQRDEEQKFQFPMAGQGVGSSGQPPLSSRSMGRESSNVSLATTLSESRLGVDSIDEANRREMRALQERKEEALAQARMRGGSLLQFAVGTGASTGSGPADVAAAPALKPYVKYTPKYNLPYGDIPRQAAPPPPAEQTAAEEKAASASGGVGSEAELAQIRSTTLFNMTGGLDTHIGVTLNAGVFGKNINQDSSVMGSSPSGPTGARGNKSAGSRRGGEAAPDASAAAAAAASAQASGANAGNFPPWLQLAVPSLASTALPVGVRAHSATKRGAKSGRSQVAASADISNRSIAGSGGDADADDLLNSSEQEGDDGGDEEKEEGFEEGEDGTFLTGVNLSASKRSSAARRRQAAEEQRIITREDVQQFHALTSVEDAVSALPRFLRPSAEAVAQYSSNNATALVSAIPGKRQAVVPPPPLPYLDLPERVNLSEIMELALKSLSFGHDEPEPTSSLSFPSNTGLFGGNGMYSNPMAGSTNSNNLSIHQLKESQFKSYFYSKESQMIIKDTYWWVLMYFFAGGAPVSREEIIKRKLLKKQAKQLAKEHGGRIPSNEEMEAAMGSLNLGSEMYAYRAYAENLKKYAEQEGFLKKQREWVKECERIRQAEKESHAQIGTQSANSGGSSGGGGGGHGNATGNAQGNAQGNSNQHTLPASHKEELQFPPAPVLTAKQKRQPLVLLGDIPHFDVNTKLNTGPVPKDLFTAASAAGASGSSPRARRASVSSVDYTSSNFLLSNLKSRISTNFVKLFLQVSSVHKDFFYLHYFDNLAQIIYYAFLVAYPQSRPLINHSFFKIRLLQLTAFWINGFIPSNLTQRIQKWRGDIQFITGEAGVNRDYQPPGKKSLRDSSDDGDAGDSSIKKSSNGEGDVGETDEDAAAAAAFLLDDFIAPPLGANGSNNNGGAPSVHPYVQQLEKKLNAHLAASGKTARALKQSALMATTASLGATASSNTSATASATASTAVLGATAIPSASPPKSKNAKSSAAVANAGDPVVATSIGHLSTVSTELTGDLLTDVGLKAARNPHRVPLRVSRKKVELHHSALIADFLRERDFANQSNHALKIPISIPVTGTGDADQGQFLDNLIGFNEGARNTTLELKKNYAASKTSFARLQSKQKKELSEIERKFEQERERALREAPAFSKTLVAEYQDRKYADLKAPSKSLALRRLGHFRQAKDSNSVVGAPSPGGKGETSSTLIKSALMM